MLNFERRTSIIYPANRLYLIHSDLVEITEVACGCIITPCANVWSYDVNETYSEKLLLASFTYDVAREVDVNQALTGMILCLLNVEHEVRVEFHSPYYSAVMYEREDIPFLQRLQANGNPTNSMMCGMLFGTTLDPKSSNAHVYGAQNAIRNHE